MEKIPNYYLTMVGFLKKVMNMNILHQVKKCFHCTLHAMSEKKAAVSSSLKSYYLWRYDSKFLSHASFESFSPKMVFALAHCNLDLVRQRGDHGLKFTPRGPAQTPRPRIPRRLRANNLCPRRGRGVCHGLKNFESPSLRSLFIKMSRGPRRGVCRGLPTFILAAPGGRAPPSACKATICVCWELGRKVVIQRK